MKSGSFGQAAVWHTKVKEDDLPVRIVVVASGSRTATAADTAPEATPHQRLTAAADAAPEATYTAPAGDALDAADILGTPPWSQQLGDVWVDATFQAQVAELALVVTDALRSPATITDRNHILAPDVCTYADEKEGIFFANISEFMLKQSKARRSGHICCDQYRTMLRKCAFGILVLNEVTADVKPMMEEDNDEVPGEYLLKNKAREDAGLPPLPVSVSRPSDPFAIQQPSDGTTRPHRRADLRPERSYRCTLGHQEGMSTGQVTNAMCVLDTHCGMYAEGEGLGLKPPTCDEHRVLGGKAEFSRISHFTVHLERAVGHVGSLLPIVILQWRNCRSVLQKRRIVTIHWQTS